MKIMHYLEILSTGISVISLIIVIYGAIIAFCAFTRNESRRFTGKYSFTATRELRADLGTYLLLGLEFLIASDILKTVLEPGLNELAILGEVIISTRLTIKFPFDAPIHYYVRSPKRPPFYSPIYPHNNLQSWTIHPSLNHPYHTRCTSNIWHDAPL